MMMDQESYLNEIDRIPFPTINYRQKINYGLSVVNFFALAMGLFMFSAPMMGWIGYESPTLGTAYMFGGYCEYIIGFYDWYSGRSLLSFVDFIFGLLHWTYYYTADLGKYEIYVPGDYYTYMQGVFYCLWFALFLVLIISVGGRGFISSCFHIRYCLGIRTEKMGETNCRIYDFHRVNFNLVCRIGKTYF